MSDRSMRLALLSGVAVSAIAIAAPEAAQAQMYTSGPGFYLSAEGRYLMNEGAKIANYDASEFGGGLFTPIVKARAEDGWGGKAMLGYRFSNNWDVGVALSGGWLKGKKSGSATTTTIGRVTATTIANTKVKVKLDYFVADFEAGYNWKMGGSNVRVFGGVRFADFSQRASSATTLLTVTPGTTLVSNFRGKRKTTYAGIGPRIGVNGQFALGAGGFHVFGGLSGALLYGKHKEKATAQFTNTTGATSNFSSSRKKNKLVPNLEGELGLGYQFGAGSGSSVSLQAGYRADAYWGAGSNSSAYTASGVTNSRSDYIFHGPFVRLTATFGPAVMAAVAPPPPAPPVVPKKNFLVFFDFDRSNITADAQKVITEAATAAKAGNVARVQLTGHTDRSGSDQYNMALSLRRGEAVKQALIRLGIPAASIAVIGRGESQPLVPTADGVREPQNRRVEILL